MSTAASLFGTLGRFGPLGKNDEGERVFREPWEAQAFALSVALHAKGLFTWTEWTAALTREIVAAQVTGDPDLGEGYYRHWLKALENIVVAKALTTAEELHERREAWDRAAQATPHGKPIVL